MTAATPPTSVSPKPVSPKPVSPKPAPRPLAPPRAALRTAALVGLAVLLPACSRGPRPRALPGAAAHPVPVLVETGRPSAPEATRERERAAIQIRGDTPDMVVYCGRARAVEDLGSPESVRERRLAGLLVEAADTRTPELVRAGAELVPPQITLTELDWEAAEVTAVVVSAFFPDPTTARLYFRTAANETAQRARWRGPGEPSFVFPGDQYVDLAVRPGFAQEDWSFEVASHPRWSGTITALRLDPVQSYGSFVIGAVHAVERGLAPGASPTVADGELVDAGLVALLHEPPGAPLAARREARRAYPALDGRAQVVLLSGAAARRVHLAWALPPEVRRLRGPVELAVTAAAVAARPAARAAPGDPAAAERVPPARELRAWRAEGAELWRATLDPETDAGRWFTTTVALPAAPAGHEHALFLDARGGGRRAGAVNALWSLAVSTVDAPRPPSVLLVTLDTVRADHVGAYGADGAATPVVDGLAERGAVFTDALATSNATSPSHATILTGLYPKDHRVLGNLAVLPEGVPTLAELLRRAGWATVASTSVRHLNADLSGLGQGFDVYLDTPPAIAGALPPELRDLPDHVSTPQPPWVRPPYRDAATCAAQVLEAVAGFDGLPVLVWTHHYDPHTPYAPEPEVAAAFWDGPDEGPRPLAERWALERGQRFRRDVQYRAADGEIRDFTPDELRWHFFARKPHLAFLGETRDPDKPRALYRAEIAQVDRDLGRLLAGLERGGRLAETLVVLTADHGESLGEREIWYDHQGVYDNTLRVPLVLAGPGVPAGARVDAPVQLTDLVPTVCELLDLGLAGEVRGTSLVPLLRGAAGPPDRRRWFEHSDDLEVGFQTRAEHFVWSKMEHPRGTLDRNVPAGTLELYDRAADPGLRHDLSDASPAGRARAEAARREAEAWLGERLYDVDAVRAPVGAEDEAALKALGYAGDDD